MKTFALTLRHLQPLPTVFPAFKTPAMPATIPVPTLEHLTFDFVSRVLYRNLCTTCEVGHVVAMMTGEAEVREKWGHVVDGFCEKARAVDVPWTLRPA